MSRLIKNIALSKHNVETNDKTGKLSSLNSDWQTKKRKGKTRIYPIYFYMYYPKQNMTHDALMTSHDQNENKKR